MSHSHASAAGRDDALNEDGASDTPLHRLPGFGTGLHRQRVAFVKAGEAPASKATQLPSGGLPGGAVSDLYLSIVLGQSTTTAAVEETTACEVCSLPLSSSASAVARHHHETCLVHQVSLDHSKPPSALNRSRFGLAIMSAQGWDPDSGRGLGADQQGMAYPIEARLRPERQALGNAASSSRCRPAGGTTAAAAASGPAPARNRAYTRKQLRAMEEDRRRRHDRLREQIMGSRDLDKYLRPQGGE
ncbi:hypothetical protein SCUCBS95973_009948 [Sporothrix curviconia]|uniref:G-patch domain-containing protein n=1 Tax=Sporothrix curviconia TaxID=1260050 RepID=A0ABP0D0T8_9PEZI